MTHHFAAIAFFLGLLSPLASAEDLRGQIERSLRTECLEVWFPRILDKENGGFLCDFDYQWRPDGRQPKSIVFQARSTWLASKAAERYPNDPRYREAADHGFKFLRDVMWDKENGGFYWRLNTEGKIEPSSQGTKHAYGVSFGIYAASAYYKLTKNDDALNLAQAGFDWMERHGHDDANLGYSEFFTRDGAKVLDAAHNPLRGDRDAIGTHVGYKSMNTHIHLLEAYTALYEVWPDEKVKTRLMELLTLARDRITVPPGAMHLFFNPDWTPVPDVNSYGHDVETAYLLLESAEVLGMRDDAKTTAVAKSLLDHALDVAWDKAKAGFPENGGVFGPIHDKSKGWWTQAEALNAFLIMSKQFPNDPRHYRELFERQWTYVYSQVIDHERGEWYPVAIDSGGNYKAAKASEWKAGYHSGRAMLNAVKWLGEEHEHR